MVWEQRMMIHPITEVQEVTHSMQGRRMIIGSCQEGLPVYHHMEWANSINRRCRPKPNEMCSTKIWPMVFMNPVNAFHRTITWSGSHSLLSMCYEPRCQEMYQDRRCQHESTSNYIVNETRGTRGASGYFSPAHSGVYQYDYEMPVSWPPKNLKPVVMESTRMGLVTQEIRWLMTSTLRTMMHQGNSHHFLPKDNGQSKEISTIWWQKQLGRLPGTIRDDLRDQQLG